MRLLHTVYFKNCYSCFSLTRVRHKESQNTTNAAINLDSSKSLILFEDYAVTEENHFQIVRIQRMLKKTNRKGIEYKEPVPFRDPCILTLDILCMAYKEISPGCYKIGSEIRPIIIPASSVLCHANLEFDQESETFKLTELELEV